MRPDSLAKPRSVDPVSSGLLSWYRDSPGAAPTKGVVPARSAIAEWLVDDRCSGSGERLESRTNA